MQSLRHIALGLSLSPMLWSGIAFAQTPTPITGVAIELNAADLVGEACRITFVVTNQTSTPIDKAIYETVLFSTDGQVLMLTLFDFGKLPAAVPRVRQFQVSDTACSRIGMVLINGANSCLVDGEEVDACTTGFGTSSRIDIKLQG
jgi:hypothetical protein